MDVRLGLATINSIKGNPCCSRSLPGGIAHHVPQVLTKKKMNLPLCRLSDTLHYVTTHRYRIPGIWYLVSYDGTYPSTSKVQAAAIDAGSF